MNILPLIRKMDEGQFLRPFSLEREMSKLFSDFFGDIGIMPGKDAEWAPRLDIAENEKEFIVKAEVPGIDSKDLDISVSGDVLKISGEKKAEHEEKKNNYHRIERSYGSFMRTVQMPAAVDSSAISAEMKNGVLEIMIPKKAVEERKKIEVKTGK